MPNKIILNGWISLDGKVYECAQMEHRNIAYEIGEEKGFEVGINFYACDMWDQGYIRFSGNENCKTPEITFDLDFTYEDKKFEPTKAQIFAMGKLQKNLVGGKNENN